MSTWSVIGFINHSFMQSEQHHVVYVGNGKMVSTSSNPKHTLSCHTEPVSPGFGPWMLCLEQVKIDFGEFINSQSVQKSSCSARLDINDIMNYILFFELTLHIYYGIGSDIKYTAVYL